MPNVSKYKERFDSAAGEILKHRGRMKKECIELLESMGFEEDDLGYCLFHPVANVGIRLKIYGVQHLTFLLTIPPSDSTKKDIFFEYGAAKTLETVLWESLFKIEEAARECYEDE